MVLREVVGHFVEATDTLKISGAYELYLTGSIITYQMNYSVGGPCECVHSAAIVPLQQEKRDGAMLQYAHIWKQIWKHLGGIS